LKNGLKIRGKIMESETKQLNLDEIKQGFEEAGIDCTIVPALDEVKPDGYAIDRDIIAFLENIILHFEDHIEELETEKMFIVNSLRWDVEVLAEDKENKLTNETKRQMKYAQLASEHPDFKRLEGEIKISRREVKKLRIELDNEIRAFQLLLRKPICNACGDDLN
jgi:hypothetical protein